MEIRSPTHYKKKNMFEDEHAIFCMTNLFRHTGRFSYRMHYCIHSVRNPTWMKQFCSSPTAYGDPEALALSPGLGPGDALVRAGFY